MDNVKLPDLSRYGVEIKIDGNNLLGRIKAGARYYYNHGKMGPVERGHPKREHMHVSETTPWRIIGHIAGEGKEAFWHSWGYNDKECRWQFSVPQGPGGWVELWTRNEDRIPDQMPEGDGWGRLKHGKRLADRIVRGSLAEWRWEWDAYEACLQPTMATA